MQQSLRRCVEGGLPLTSELSIEPLSKEEAENLANYFESVNLSVKKIMEGPAFPINDEYCWVHDDRDGQDMGGWTCQHVECKSAE
jgi:hypothetical protein